MAIIDYYHLTKKNRKQLEKLKNNDPYRWISAIEITEKFITTAFGVRQNQIIMEFADMLIEELVSGGRDRVDEVYNVVFKENFTLEFYSRLFEDISTVTRNTTDVNRLRRIIAIKKGLGYLLPFLKQINTKSEVNYQEDILAFVDFLRSHFKHYKFEVDILKFEGDSLNSKRITLPLEEFLSKVLLPQSLCLLLFDRKVGQFLIKTSFGLNKDLVEKVSFSKDDLLPYWLSKKNRIFLRDGLEEVIPKIRHKQIKGIQAQMDLINAQVCISIFGHRDSKGRPIFIGFLGLGKRLIGRYSLKYLLKLTEIAMGIDLSLMNSASHQLLVESFRDYNKKEADEAIREAERILRKE